MSVMRRSLQVVTLIATLLVGTTAAVIIVSQTAWFKDWLRGVIERQANNYLNGQLTIRRLGGNLFYGVELDDVAVRMNGEPIVSVDQIGLDYSVFQLLSKGLIVDDIRLDRPVLYLRREGERWNVTTLIKKQAEEADRRGPRRPIEINEIGISGGTLVIDENRPVGTGGVAGGRAPAIDVPAKIDRLDAKLAFRYSPVHYTIEIGHVSFRTVSPNVGLNSLSGRIATKDDRLYFEKVAIRTEESSLLVDGDVEHYRTRPVVHVRASSDKFVTDEIARIVPALGGIHLQPSFAIEAAGPMDKLAVDLDVRSLAGAIDGEVTVDAMAPRRTVAGEVHVQRLDLAPLLKNPARKTDITGTATIDLRLAEAPAAGAPFGGLSGRFHLDAPAVTAFGYRARQVVARGRLEGGRIALDARALAYGGRATAAGTITPPRGPRGAVAYDLKGSAADLDLRSLPPQVKAPGVASNLDLDYHVIGAGSTVRGDVQLRPSTLAGGRIAGGTVASFAFAPARSAGARPHFAYTAKGAVSNLDLQAVGRGFRIAALTADRYRSAIGGRFDVAGSGTDPQTLRLDATGDLVESTLFGAAIPAMSYEAHLAGGGLRAKANGRFVSLDPAVVTARPNLAGDLTGAANVEVAIADLAAPMTPDSIDAAGTVSLEASTMGDLTITRASVDGSYQRRLGNIRELVVVSPDANVTAAGTLALDRTGASNLKYHVDTSDAARIAKLFDQPIGGALTLDGTVAGNASSLRAQGEVGASNISYRQSNALAVNGAYQVTIPDLDAKRARITANTDATFVKVGGQEINELTSKIEYSQSRLAFDATAQQGPRNVSAAGSLVLHPDHQEVHLTNAVFRAQNVEWTMEPGSEAAIQYGAERIVVQGVRLVSGVQRIVADGTIGETATALDVKATDVDLVQAQALALVDYGVKGRLNADARISGAVRSPQIAGKFAVDQGAFRDFTFQSLGGTIDYTAAGFKVDARLEQTPDAWLTAVGYLPRAALRPAAAPGEHQATAPGEAVDLRVQSSTIDLGVVQGFTTAVTNVAGSLQADVHVRGTARDPHLNGYLDVRNGAFAIPFARTRYSGLDTRIEFAQDRARIAGLTLVDEHEKTMTVSGELAVHERQVGAVNLAIKSDGFEVIDNEFADVKLNADLRVAGELRRPRVEGDLEVDSAVIFADPILAQTANDYYATEATTVVPPQPAVQAPGGGGTIFDALAMNIRVLANDNLIVRARDLKVGQSAFGAGALNVTLGGDIRATKDAGQKMRLLGAVNTVRGTYDFQGRRFEILRDGRIRFVGGTEINPDLDITASRVISGVEARVHIGGAMMQPALQLTSRPPLDEADILSLIVFGAPVNSLGEGQQVSLASRAGALATGFVASSLAESISSALELDVFEIQTTADESGPGGNVTLGEQLGSGLFVKFRQGFGAQPTSEFILEYELADFLRLQAAIAENGGSANRQLMRRVERGGIDLIFFFSY